MEKWLAAALDYVPQWLEFQLRALDRPGCSVAIMHRGQLVFERAFGSADLGTGAKLTPRHRFRVASHSKSFTAAAILKLREQGKLRLDDPVGCYVEGLHRDIAAATIQQLLSHSAGIIRDGFDGGQWTDRRPFLSAAEIRKDLRGKPVIEANTRFKYSNHGYALLGLAMEQITGDSYAVWMKREIVDAAGLTETRPDMPLPKVVRLASGHSGKLLLGRRVIIPGRNPTNALAPATGFVSTAADMARFYAQLSPKAKTSILSVPSRREMVRRQWRDESAAIESYYGLGVGSGALNGWDWFGHGGGFQGFITRTAVFHSQDIAISVLTNSTDGLAGPWLDGIVHILQGFQKHGAPTPRVRPWAGRWWSPWGGAVDMLPMGNRVLAATPAFFNPLLDASELELTGRDRAKIVKANGTASHGESVRLLRNKAGRTTELHFAASRMLPEAKVAAEMRAPYEGGKRRRRKA